MRILAVVPLYPPHSRVGAWLATHEYLAGAVATGHDVDVVTYAKTSLGAYELDGVTVHPARVLNDLNGDVVVAHLGDDGTGARVATRLRVPLVYMVHGHTEKSRRKIVDCDLAVFNSHATAAEIGWDGPSIVAPPITRPALVETTPGDRVTLVNLAESKGGGLFARLVAKMPETEFLGVRGGYGIQVVPTGTNVRTIWPTRNVRDDIYRRTRILLMPSEREAWGMTAVEAMSSGIPVIAHPTGGLVESLGDAGIFVDRSDLAGWVAEIQRLDDPDEWCAASARALASASELSRSVTSRLDLFVESIERTIGASCV